MADKLSVPRWLIAALVVAILGAGAFVAYRYVRPRESTDDAQVNGHVTPIAARVGGTVKAVHVQDNQRVNAGDLLIEIDPRDYEIALQHAEADLAAAEASARAARTAVPISTATTGSQLSVAQAATGNAEAAATASDREVEASRAKLDAARARLAEATALAHRASQDLERLKPLVAKDEISRQQFDAAVATQEAAKAATDSAAAAVTEAQANVAVAEARRAQAGGALRQAQAETKAASTAPQQVALTQAHAETADAQVMQARAAVDQAKLTLERASIRAPAAGVVSRKSVEVGQVIQPGQPLLALAALTDVWITANFKETQLEHMRPGQRVSIDVDTSGRTYSGRVDSIAAATGATFSLLPPDNASGNFVKVVQRVPVKITLDPGQNDNGLLRPGMSATATVYLK